MLQMIKEAYALPEVLTSSLVLTTLMLIVGVLVVIARHNINHTASQELEMMTDTIADAVTVTHVSYYRTVADAEDPKFFKHFCEEGDILFRIQIRDNVRLKAYDDHNWVHGAACNHEYYNNGGVIFFSFQLDQIKALPLQTDMVHRLAAQLMKKHTKNSVTPEDIVEIKTFRYIRDEDKDTVENAVDVPV